MIYRHTLFAVIVIGMTTPLAAHKTLSTGIWTDTEGECFPEEENRSKLKCIASQVDEDCRLRSINAFGAVQSEWPNEAIANLPQATASQWKKNSREWRRAKSFPFGLVGKVDIDVQALKGSFYDIRSILFRYYEESAEGSAERSAGTERVLEVFEKGALSVTIGQANALTDAGKADSELQSDKTTGSTVLLP